MTWTLGGIRIFVTDVETNNNKIVARLFPYDSDTVHQYFGYENPATTLVCKVVGTTDTSALQGFTTTNDSHELVSPQGSLGNFIIKSINFKLEPSVRQTLRQDLPLTTWVYNAKIEIYQDV